MNRLVILLISCVVAGCGNRTAPAPLPGPTSARGWDIRYNAVLALAHRGSDKVADEHVRELLNEMLDEERQLRNFTTTLPSGAEAPDPAGARTAILGAIRALNDYCAKRGPAGLQPFRPALEKLTSSSTRALAQEARTLLDKLDAK